MPLVIHAVSSALIVHTLRDPETRSHTCQVHYKRVADGEGVPLIDQIRFTTNSTGSNSPDPSSPNSGTSDDVSVNDVQIDAICDTTVFCATDSGVNDTLTCLHNRLKHGDRSTQRTIDRYLLLCACENSVSGRNLHNLVMAADDVPHYDTLPDITRYIPHSFTTTRESGIIGYYIQLLSPLKRKSRTRRGTPVTAECQVEACICLNLIQATLLGLYPRASKQPLWYTRVAIAACIHKLQTSKLDVQRKFLAASHDLLRLCFTEYILNVRTDFCPVENAFLVKQAMFLPNYDAACVTLCDYIRQTCVQSKTWSWAHINAVALSSLDRISRMCRTRLISSIPTPAMGNIKISDIHEAMQAHVVYPDPNIYGYMNQNTIIQHALYTNMLPWNIIRAQTARIMANFEHTLFPIMSVCEKNICIKCVLSLNCRILPRVSKLRMDTDTTTLSCANCNSHNTVVRINMLGKLLTIRNVSYFSCQECTALHEYDPIHPLMCTKNNQNISLPLFDPHNIKHENALDSSVHGALVLSTPNEQLSTKIHLYPPNTINVCDRKHRCKWCGRVCSSRVFQLIHTMSVSVVYMTLCFKHMPPLHMLSMIKDTNALMRYIRNSPDKKV